jgi:TolB-like protein/Flp pilus assembly protein TadD
MIQNLNRPIPFEINQVYLIGKVSIMGKLQTKDLWSQLKKRKVVRVAVVYLVVAWLAIFIGIFTFHELGFPPWVLSLLMALFLLGFPVALVLTWAYEITPHGIRRDTTGDIETLNQFENQPEETPSVAVLPFTDLSEDGGQAYFCEGLAEEIQDTLRKVPDFRVASRSTAFQIKSEDADPAEAGKKLKVDALLKGAACKTGDKLHLKVELVDARDGSVRWSKQFDKPLDAIFEIQEKIIRAVLKSMDVSIKNDDILKRQQVSPRAYDLFLHGLSCFAQHTTQDNVYARQLFKQCIDLEPDFGRAWAALAYTYGYSYMYFNATDVNLTEAKRTSAQALRLAPHLAESHVSSGIACCMSQNYKKAEAEFERAIECDPRNFRAWYFFGRAKVQEGDLERALKLFERAAMVRPEDFQSVLLQAQLYTSLGDDKKALAVTRLGIERVKSVLELNPENNRALNMGAFALLRLGQLEQAKTWMSKSMRNAPMDSIIQYNGACFYSLAGDPEKALDCLENCLIKVGNINREWLEHDSDMDNIRNHPRFSRIVSRFPE